MRVRGSCHSPAERGFVVDDIEKCFLFGLSVYLCELNSALILLVELRERKGTRNEI